MADAWQIFFTRLSAAKAALDAVKDSAKDAKDAVNDTKAAANSVYDPKGTLGGSDETLARLRAEVERFKASGDVKAMQMAQAELDAYLKQHGGAITGGEDSMTGPRRFNPFALRSGMRFGAAGLSPEEMAQLADETERAVKSQDRLRDSISKTQSAWKRAQDQKLADTRNLIKSIKAAQSKGDQAADIIASFMASYIAALKGDSFSASRKVWIRAELEKWGAMWGLDVDSLDELFRRGMIE